MVLFFSVLDKQKGDVLIENKEITNIKEKKVWKKVIENSFAYGQGLMQALCGIPVSFNVFFATPTGEQISGSLIKKANLLTVNLHPIFIEVEQEVDAKTDTIIVKFTIPKLRAGKYTIDVILHGEHITGSPFALNAKNGSAPSLLISILHFFTFFFLCSWRGCRPFPSRVL